MMNEMRVEEKDLTQAESDLLAGSQQVNQSIDALSRQMQILFTHWEGRAADAAAVWWTDEAERLRKIADQARSWAEAVAESRDTYRQADEAVARIWSF